MVMKNMSVFDDNLKKYFPFRFYYDLLPFASNYYSTFVTATSISEPTDCEASQGDLKGIYYRFLSFFLPQPLQRTFFVIIFSFVLYTSLAYSESCEEEICKTLFELV